jgi:hypothetical protein
MLGLSQAAGTGTSTGKSIEGRKLPFNHFWYQISTGKAGITTRESLKNLELTLNYYANGSMYHV